MAKASDNFLLFWRVLPKESWILVFVLGVFATVMLHTNTLRAEGIVARVITAPVHPNGLVRDHRTGINIYLQTEANPGERFLDPAVTGYGLPAGGSMEIEMVSGFQRDASIPLDGRTILMVSGTPQQPLPAPQSGFTIEEGSNPRTYLVKPTSEQGLDAETLVSSAPGAAFDPVRQRGIKSIHIGRKSAFVSRGETGVVAVRIRDAKGNVIASGKAETEFLPNPVPQVFPTNIPHDQRNHNWQRVGVNQILGVARNTLPLAFILYGRNGGLENIGMDGVGVLSQAQLNEIGFVSPKPLERYNGGLIIRDRDKDGKLDPVKDEIVGGFEIEAPAGASGFQVLTPIVSDKPFLSVPTTRYNPRAGSSIGGSILQVVFIAGNVPGIYRVGFAMLGEPGNSERVRDPEFHYTIVVE